MLKLLTECRLTAAWREPARKISPSPKGSLRRVGVTLRKRAIVPISEWWEREREGERRTEHKMARERFIPANPPVAGCASSVFGEDRSGQVRSRGSGKERITDSETPPCGSVYDSRLISLTGVTRAARSAPSVPFRSSVGRTYVPTLCFLDGEVLLRSGNVRWRWRRCGGGARACMRAYRERASVRARVLVSEYDNVRRERCPLFALFCSKLSLPLHLSLRLSSLSLSFFFLSLLLDLSPSLPLFVSLCLSVRFALLGGVWCNELENQYPSTGKYRPRLATACAPRRKSRSLFRERTVRSPFPPDAWRPLDPPKTKIKSRPASVGSASLPLPFLYQRVLRSLRFLPSRCHLLPSFPRQRHQFLMNSIR